MNRPTVYLAGPITGLSYGECTDWRETVTNQLLDCGIIAFSPMRNKQFLSGETKIHHSYSGDVMSCQRGIYARDKWDVLRVDVVLFNLLGAQIVSIGTVMEVAWAADRGKPAVLVMEAKGNIHTHPMLLEACPFFVHTLDDGVDTVKRLLSQ